MAKLPGAFNAEEVGEMNSFDPIPKGDYRFRIKDTDRKENSKATGFVYKFIFEVMEGDHKGRLVFANLNLEHESPQTVEMAEKELGAIVKACGMVTIDDTEELHGEELMATVAFKKGNANHSDSNVIRKYFPCKDVARPPKPSATKSSSGDKAAPKKKKVSFE